MSHAHGADQFDSTHFGDGSAADGWCAALRTGAIRRNDRAIGTIARAAG